MDIKIGVPGILGVAFVVLKLCHVIDWSWWLVTMPFWIVPAFFLGAALLSLLAVFLLWLIFDDKGKGR